MTLCHDKRDHRACTQLNTHHVPPLHGNVHSHKFLQVYKYSSHRDTQDCLLNWMYIPLKKSNFIKDICQIIKIQIPRHSPSTHICPSEHFLSPHWQSASTIPNWQTGCAKHSPFAQVSPGSQVLIPQRHLGLPIKLDVHFSEKIKFNKRYLPNN